VSSRQSDDSTALYNARGQCAGILRDGWLVKRVDTRRHQLRKPPAWAIDLSHLDRLQAIGGCGVLLVDETGTEWRATVQAFHCYGVPIDRGHGPQIALPLARWRCIAAGQLVLFSEEGGA
jgi:hypothetical protein